MTNSQDGDIKALMEDIGRKAKDAARTLALAPSATKNDALGKAASALRDKKQAILAANQADLEAGRQKSLAAPLMDRLALDEGRIEAIAEGLEAIAGLSDPLGEVMGHWQRPNGLDISRVRVPLGVIGVIYESRPNVTADAGALCLKAGNAAILRGGSESIRSSAAIMEALKEGLIAASLPEASIQLVPTPDRAAVGALLKMSDYIDVIVPRGGKSLIERITAESKIPLFKHLEGICHTYVDKAADLDMAKAVTLNAKMRRPGICGATETVLLDARLDDIAIKAIIETLIDGDCEVRGDSRTAGLDERVISATKDDWDTEYLDAIVSVAVVDGVSGAIEHISRHSSQHTECIISEDPEAVNAFLNQVDSAIVMVNASTQFADGGEFGMGAEIGISTGKLHARGPVGVEQLTSFKYLVRGRGQCRP
jgi:glutamate-5-semialdehyde dehydrogenase